MLMVGIGVEAEAFDERVGAACPAPVEGIGRLPRRPIALHHVGWL
jgi:hypothetical protein